MTRHRSLTVVPFALAVASLLAHCTTTSTSTTDGDGHDAGSGDDRGSSNRDVGTERESPWDAGSGHDGGRSTNDAGSDGESATNDAGSDTGSATNDAGSGPESGTIPDGGRSCGTPPVPGTSWSLVIDEEFDAPQLDAQLWKAWYAPGSIRTANGISSYMDNTQALSFANGRMVLAGFQAPNNLPGCGGIVSSADWGPGYYEARVMAGSSWSAFWVQGIGADCTPITAGVEADVLETNPTWAPTSQHAVHWSGYSTCAQSSTKNPLNLSPTSFHVIGMDWSTVRGMTFYVDGVQTYSVASATPANAAQTRFTMEGVCNSTVPMQVDWFCYFKEL